MSSLVERMSSLHIGSVESVAPDSISVRLDLEAPATMALNAGVPVAFPRLNSYVLMPKESGTVVGLVVWLGIAAAASIPRKRDANLIELPFPDRKIVVTPVGTLLVERGPTVDFRLERGVVTFPSVGDEVLLPTRDQLRAIIEPSGSDDRVQVGTAILAAGAKVSFDPDRLFGRHVAVLGNTGSGKSCTVAGLVRWSLEAASAASIKSRVPNARFIILDPNGEYRNAFDGVPGGVRHFRVPPVGMAQGPLTVPAWLWNGHEWSAFAAASPRVQRPLLMQALRDLRSAGAKATTYDHLVARTRARLSQMRDRIKALSGQGPIAQDAPAKRRTIGDLIVRFVEGSRRAVDQGLKNTVGKAVTELANAADGIAARRASGNGWYDTFGSADFDDLVDNIEKALGALPAAPPIGVESEDAPVPFAPNDLIDRLEVLSQDEASGNAASFVASLLLRVRTMFADRRMGAVIAPKESPSLEQWLEDIVGGDGAKGGTVGVLDLSLVPSDVIHVVVAVLARVVFEATQRYRRHYGEEIPTVLVLEEAHTFIQRHDEGDSDIPTSSQLCRHTFERIAREGRKFGLGLLLSSQRPSELSPTVLAQCNTFVLHRLVNDRDQDLVQRLVPDNLAGLLKELPTLPTRHAILLGWATPLPVLMQVRELAREHRPSSGDPEYWATWSGRVSRPIDWKAIADEWAMVGPTAAATAVPEDDGENEDEDPFA